jgi:hypothetical protein
VQGLGKIEVTTVNCEYTSRAAQKPRSLFEYCLGSSAVMIGQSPDPVG